MKIAIESNVLTYEATGVAKALLNLINSTQKLYPNIEVICFSTKKIIWNFDFKVKNIIIHDFIPKFIKNIIYMQIYKKVDFILYPWNGKIIKSIPSDKNILILHDVLPLEIPNYFPDENARNNYIDNTQKNIDSANIIFTPSHYSKKQIEKNFNCKKTIYVMPWGTTIGKTNIVSNLGKESKYFIYLGGYDQRKGIDKMIKVFIYAHGKKLIKSKVILVGTPIYYSQEFKALVNQAKEIGILEEKGYIAEEELLKILLNAQGLIYPSLYEGFGLPPLEAMSVGCPVITTEGTSLPEICADAVLYVNPNSTEEFMYKIKLLEEDKDVRDSLIKKGFKQSSNFSFAKTSEIFMNTLIQINRNFKYRDRAF